MAGVVAHTPTVSTSARSSPAVNSNGNANLDYINGHGTLPESPASSGPPPPATTKKGKPPTNQKPQDDQKKTEKLLAARINELEQNTKGDKEQEAEIGMSFPTSWAQIRQVQHTAETARGPQSGSPLVLDALTFSSHSDL